MSVWFVCPSKRPPEEVEPIFKLWKEHGYGIAIAVDSTEEAASKKSFADIVISSPAGYRGYSHSVNSLTELVLKNIPKAEWIVCAGDDTEPDPNHSAEEIARECELYFGAVAFGQQTRVGGTWGVMQPTGDRWGDRQGAYIDRVAGSPWMGREFCLRVNQGRGPLWPDYFHCFADEELQHVATRLGVLWQRPDLVHLHKHWGRGPDNTIGNAASMPAFLKRANSSEEWKKAKALFTQRKAAGFPGSNPL